MNLKKQCPSCEFANPEEEFFCSKCGADITGVKPEPLPDPKPVPAPDKAKPCPQCGAENESYAVLCSRCGARLDGKAKKLLLVVGSRSYECKSGDVLGRDGTLACQVFEGIPTVSARHVELQLCNGEWRVVNLPLEPGKTAKNLTALDGREVAIGASVVVTGEHVLRLSTRWEGKLRVV